MIVLNLKKKKKSEMLSAANILQKNSINFTRNTKIKLIRMLLTYSKKLIDAFLDNMVKLLIKKPEGRGRPN